MDNELQVLRQNIDAIDEQIQALINQRAQYAKEVGLLKAQYQKTDFYRPEREAQILRGIIDRNQGPMPSETVAKLMREIISACLALEAPLDIAYLGPKGTYTQEAALKHFGHAVVTHAYTTVDEIFHAVEAEETPFGVVPIENSIEGMVNNTLTCLIRFHNIKICGEVLLPIHHQLSSNAKNLTDIKEVFAHQQALAQCRAWLDNHLANANRIAVSSNAEAAKQVSINQHSAAICSQEAAEIYNLSVLAKNIEDEPSNTTRFLIIGKQDIGQSGEDKTSILLATANQPGALYHLLQPFAENNINLTKIESRPIRDQVWQYVFFIDMEGHIKQEKLASILKKVKENTSWYRELGSYPKAVY